MWAEEEYRPKQKQVSDRREEDQKVDLWMLSEYQE